MIFGGSLDTFFLCLRDLDLIGQFKKIDVGSPQDA
jgi:hypothetical protein